MKSWTHLFIIAFICGFIDFFAASFQPIGGLHMGFFDWFLYFTGISVLVTFLFRFGCALLAALIVSRIGLLASILVSVTVLFSVPFIDTFLVVILAGWLEDVSVS